MKKAILLFAGILATVAVMAQGSLNFTTFQTGVVNAKVTDGVGGPAAGADFWAGLYWGTSKDSLAPVVLVGQTDAAKWDFGTGTKVGYVFAGKILIKGASGAGFIKMVAWAKTGGNTYAAALGKAKTGESNIIPVTLGDDAAVPPTTPGSLGGPPALQGFAVVPEPSIIALGVLGGIALLLRRRS